MKYFIVGLHSSGKREIMNSLASLGVQCGKLFSDIEEPNDKFYESDQYEIFPTKEINGIFENNAYIFMQRINLYGHSFYEGLSKYEFEHKDVFVFSPDQLSAAVLTNIKEPYCFIWVDNTKMNRYNRYRDEGREYSFAQREEQETKDLGYFVSVIYDSGAPILYFNNEDPQRISTIIYTLVKYPELFDQYKNTFNN